MKCNTYICDYCHTEMRAFFGVPGYYQIAEDRRIIAPSAPVWCNDCLKLSTAEALPANDFAAQEIERCISRRATDEEMQVIAELGDSVEDHFRRRKEWLHTLLEYLGTRTSNRCLACGGSSIDFLDVDEFGRTPATVTHGGCIGSLRLQEDDRGILSPRYFFLLDTAGNLINDYPA